MKNLTKANKFLKQIADSPNERRKARFFFRGSDTEHMEVESTRQNRDMKLRYREKQTENSVAYLEQTIWRFAVEQFAEQGHFIKLLNPIFSFRNREPFVNVRIPESEAESCLFLNLFKMSKGVRFYLT